MVKIGPLVRSIPATRFSFFWNTVRHIFQFQFLLYIKSPQDSLTAVYIESVPNSTCGAIIIDMDNYLVSLG